MKVINNKGDQYESTDPLFLQQGGNVEGNNQVFTHRLNALDTRPIGTSTTTEKKTKEDSKTDNLIGGDLIKNLIGKGITSDVNASVQELMQMQQNYAQLGDIDKTSRQGMVLLNQMLLAATKVNALLRNAETFKAGQAEALKNDAMGEIAVTPNGLVLQGQDGKLKLMSPEDYGALDQEERTQYRTLTNAQLIDEREQKLYLLNDTQSFQLLNSSTGFSKIGKEIKDIMGTISMSKTTQTQDLYTDPTGKLQEGLKRLKLVSVDPIDNILVTLSQEGNESSAMYALDAMWLTIGDNSKVFLKSRAAMEGYGPEQLEQVAKSYLVKLTNPKIVKNVTSEQKVDLGSKKKADEAGLSGKAPGGVEIKFWDTFANDKIPREMTLLGPEGGAFLFIVPASQYGPMRNNDQTPYIKKSMGEITELNTLTDKDAASFGGEQVINNTLQQGIAYNGDSLYRMELPYRMDPHTHKIVPDFKLLVGYEALVKEIGRLQQSGKTLTVGDKMNIFKRNGITELNINGEPKNLRSFLATSVYIGEEIYKKLDEESKRYLVGQDNEGLKNIMINTFGQKADKDIYEKGDDIYKGLIYYPINTNAGVLAGSINDAGGMKLGDLTNRTMTQQMRAGISNQAMNRTYDMNLLQTQLEENAGE